jgi:hypothetical protein
VKWFFASLAILSTGCSDCGQIADDDAAPDASADAADASDAVDEDQDVAVCVPVGQTKPILSNAECCSGASMFTPDGGAYLCIARCVAQEHPNDSCNDQAPWQVPCCDGGMCNLSTNKCQW